MFVFSVLVVLTAWYVGHLFNRFYPLTQFWVSMLDYAGYVFWGTALAESKVHSWTENTPPEILYKRLQMLCSEAGIFVFVLAQAIEPIH